MKRLFLAIATHEGLEKVSLPILKKLRIHADQRELEIRWMQSENYHVTLAFLGNTKMDLIPSIETILEEVVSIVPPFDLKISDVGAFPDDTSSRVLWFGVQNSKNLRHLQNELAEKLKDKVYTAENRDFIPHIMIARLRSPHKTKDMISPFVRKSIAKIHVTELVLYESVGAPPFTKYKALKSFKLQGIRTEEDSID